MPFRTTIYLLAAEGSSAGSLPQLLDPDAWDVRVVGSVHELQNPTPDRSRCLIIDWEGPGYEVLEVISEVRATCPTMPVIVISSYSDVALIVRTIRRGANDFLKKPVGAQALLDSLHWVLTSPRSPLPRKGSPGSDRFSLLTERETEVLEKIVGGFTSKQIASTLGISKKTVDTHRHNIMKKTKAKSVGDLVRITMLEKDLGSNQDAIQG